ncbi:Ribonuclease D [Arsenophonus endosymbiont of Bemisia tabaci Q2]|nr:Ribonuclease D [Arsenophonus endosymbiont of Bemisia tabaci Q2]
MLLKINHKEKDVLNYQLITTDAQLKKVCQVAAKTNKIALDTEFVRVKTYYPQFGLIQVYDGEQLSLIDPIAITNMEPFRNLLTDGKVTKILHAGSEDIEVFLHHLACVPQPMLDTQIMAAFLGHRISSGFASLVNEYLTITLDKSESRTDWLIRPLSDKQCQYAAADVFFLLPLAETLLSLINQLGYLPAVTDECQRILLRRQEILSLADAYKSIKNSWQLRAQQLACLKQLAAWRLNQARRRDLAVNFIVREEHLWKIARYLPNSLTQLHTLGLTGQEIRYHGQDVLQIVANSCDIKENSCLQPLYHLINHPQYREAFEAVKTLTKQIGEQAELNSELLASRRQINQLLAFHWGLKKSDYKPDLLAGWRGQLLSAPLKQLLELYC